MPGNKYRSKFKKSRKGFKGKPSWETLGNEEQVSRPLRPIFVPAEKAPKANSDKQKKRRSIAQQLKAAREDTFKKTEGISYGAGTF